MVDGSKAYYANNHNVLIPTNHQFLAVCCGERNSGKSMTQELLLTLMFENGWTCFDAYSAGFESMFYIVNQNCKTKRLEKIEELEHQKRVAIIRHQAKQTDYLSDKIIETKNKLGCSCYKRYPTTILVNEAIDISQISLNKINGVYYSKEEWVSKMRAKGEILIEYEDSNPPVKPQSERGTEWLKVVKLPTPNVKDGSKNNLEIVKIVESALVDCRNNKRILSFVPALFPSSFSKNRTLGVIIEGLPSIMDNHFIPHTENDLGKPKEKWTKYEKNYHQLCVLLREVGELAEDGMYADPNAKYVKRPIQKIVRVSRHHHISILFDLQRLEDFSKKMRTQVNTIILKRTPNKLLGEELKFVKDWVEQQQSFIFNKHGKNEETMKYAYSHYPPLNQLNKNVCYAVYADDWITKFAIPSCNHHHKQEEDDIKKVVPFSYSINQSVIDALKTSKDTASAQVDAHDKELFDFIKTLRDKKEQWKSIRDMLIEKQKHGKFTKANDFSSMTHDSIRVWFKRTEKKHQTP
ncbi:MAG: hypothetical protein ISR79_02615 [Nitrosopumilus sp.]|nr:hypothetical protein [Nitrosopumilus sp.]